MKIKIQNKYYTLNAELAINLGALIENRTPKPGDVYIDPKKNINPFLLVRVTDDSYQLLGLCGVETNSGNFFEETHSLQEIEEYLNDEEMVFFKNIKEEIYDMVLNCEIQFHKESKVD